MNKHMVFQLFNTLKASKFELWKSKMFGTNIYSNDGEYTLITAHYKGRAYVLDIKRND